MMSVILVGIILAWILFHVSPPQWSARTETMPKMQMDMIGR